MDNCFIKILYDSSLPTYVLQVYALIKSESVLSSLNSEKHLGSALENLGLPPDLFSALCHLFCLRTMKLATVSSEFQALWLLVALEVREGQMGREVRALVYLLLACQAMVQL